VCRFSHSTTGTFQVVRRLWCDLGDVTTWYALDRVSLAWYAPERPGVYAIARGRVVLYVGQAQNLRERLQAHLAERENGLLLVSLAGPGTAARFVFEEVPRQLLDDVERAWIRRLEPTCNRRAA